MSTDTGPMIELVTAPSLTLDRIAAQLAALQDESHAALDRLGCATIDRGVHPALRPVPDLYYRYRTPRPAYDYAIAERGWKHWTILDKAAVQELVDVPFADAPRALAALHRLAGLMNFVLRNDAGVHGERRLSVRSLAWRSHVPREGPFAADAAKVLVPPEEIASWRDYLTLLWDTGPMFLVGTKNGGQASVSAHPTFLEFLRNRDPNGWEARLLDGSPARVVPEAAHVVTTDWSYMGYARLRWKWREPIEPAEIVDAWESGTIEALLARALEKVVIENRSTSTQPDGEDLVSLALVAGLMANLDETAAFTATAPYAFWLRLLDDSTRLPLTSNVDGRSILSLAREMIAIAHRGLALRGEPSPDRWLAPLQQRLADGLSPSERRGREV